MIKKITINELDDLEYICKETFMETFENENSKEDMSTFLEKSYSKEVLKKELNDKDSNTYIYYENEEALGYLKINKPEAQTEQFDNNCLEIQRIYILKKAKGKGIGSKFMELAENFARDNKLDYVWLGVWEFNYSAQEFYKNKGYEEFSSHIFILGKDKQKDLLMKKYI